MSDVISQGRVVQLQGVSRDHVSVELGFGSAADSSVLTTNQLVNLSLRFTLLSFQYDFDRRSHSTNRCSRNFR